MKILRISLVACLGVCSLRAAPVPPEEDLEAARPAVSQQAEGDFRRLKSGASSHAETAEAFRAHAAEATSDAVRYLFVRAAFRQHALSGDAGAIVKCLADVAADAGVVYAGSVARFALPALEKLRAQGKPGVKELFEILEAVDKRAQDPDAQAYFAFERDYPCTGLSALTCNDLGDYWWGSADAEQDGRAVTHACHAQAVAWYRRALVNGSARDTLRGKAERRLAAFEKEPSFAPPPQAVAQAEEASAPETEKKDGEQTAAETPAEEKPAEEKPMVAEGEKPAEKADEKPAETNAVPEELSVAIARGVTILFRAPGRGFDLAENLRVTPWRVTYEQFRCFRKISRYESGMLREKAEFVRVKIDEAEDFCKWLAKRHRAKLPPGAVCRLPTAQERLQEGAERWELLKDEAFKGPAGFFVVLDTSGKPVKGKGRNAR